jgi:hypothetical protein
VGETPGHPRGQESGGVNERPRTHREALEWFFARELEERNATRLTGWLYNDVDRAHDWDGVRDITADLCLARGQFRTEEFHDPCIANLPGVVFACCGHGRSGCYVDGFFGFGDRVRVFGGALVVDRLRGPTAARKMRELGGRPPRRRFCSTRFEERASERTRLVDRFDLSPLRQAPPGEGR